MNSTCIKIHGATIKKNILKSSDVDAVKRRSEAVRVCKTMHVGKVLVIMHTKMKLRTVSQECSIDMLS